MILIISSIICTIIISFLISIIFSLDRKINDLIVLSTHKKDGHYHHITLHIDSMNDSQFKTLCRAIFKKQDD